MKTIASTLLLVSALVLPLAAAAPPPSCPAAVTGAIAKQFPKATVQRCKAEREDGHDQFEVKLTKADGGKLEVDVSPAGAILQTEEVVGLDQVPAAVMKAFAAKYPKAKPTRAEKQTPATGKASYELAFQTDGKRKEATFAEDGRFVEEE
ncbi:MAG: PepSY-like domain-containing protein [Kofleriaceae bacterium]